MFYFIINLLLYLILFLILYYYFSIRRKIKIIDFLIMIFCVNMYFFFLVKGINVVVGLILTILIVLIIELYQFIFVTITKDKINDKVLINRGVINFKSLIANKYPYQKLIKNLSSRGIKDLSSIDYTILYNNELLIFKSDIKNYPVSLIVDGKVIYDHLYCIKKNCNWLNAKIEEENIAISDISYAFFKDDKVYFLMNV